MNTAAAGFQGGLNWYRVRWDSRFTREAEVFSGRTIDVPSAFIAGKSDWGVYQAPPAFERMQHSALTKMRFCELIDGAGHWVQQEQPEAVSRLAAEVPEGSQSYLTGVPVRVACRAIARGPHRVTHLDDAVPVGAVERSTASARFLAGLLPAGAAIDGAVRSIVPASSP